MSDINITINVYVRPIVPVEQVRFNIVIHKERDRQEEIKQRLDEYHRQGSAFNDAARYIIVQKRGINYVLHRYIYRDYMTIHRPPIDLPDLEYLCVFAYSYNSNGEIVVHKDRQGNLNDQ